MSYFDDRVAERDALRIAESLAAQELTELDEGTAAIEQGMSNPVLWLAVIGGLVATPFTLGLSLIVSFAAGVAMNGGPSHMVKSAMPMSVDIVAPKAGCIRVIAGLLTIALVCVAAILVGCVILFLTVQP